MLAVGLEWSQPIDPQAQVLADRLGVIPGTIIASSLFGQVYVSDDHAATWRKLDREFGEIRGLALTPAVA